MASNNSDYQPPDLASVLRTLAALAPQGQQTSNPSVSSSNLRLPDPVQGPELQRQQQPWGQPVGHTPDPPRPITGSNPGQKIIDPATIIDWSSGLRCVMKTVARHDSVLDEIQKMIKVQNEHEKQWWDGRVALVKKQEARIEGQKKLDEMLKAVGSTASSGSSRTRPDELAEELKTFDMKVYRAQTQMAKEMSARLKGLGVPFFGTRAELIKTKGSEDASGHGEASNQSKDMIDESDLVELQRKMLVILEDLCRDECMT